MILLQITDVLLLEGSAVKAEIVLERFLPPIQFQPLGASGDSLTSGDIIDTTETVVGFLSGRFGYFSVFS